MPEPSTLPGPAADPAADADSLPSLDELYWHTDLSTAEIARCVGVPARQLHRRVAPLDAGVACRWCGAALTHTSRSSRIDARIRCSACGSTRQNPLHRDSLPPCRPSVVGGLIVVRERERSRWDRWDPGWEIDTCVDALAVAGVAWDPTELVVLGAVPADGADVVGLLADRDPGIVAVHDLRQLASTQTERLQALFALTRLHWRVIVARDIDGERSQEIRARHLTHLDERYDPDGRWSPSWSDHLVSETYDDGRSFGDWR